MKINEKIKTPDNYRFVAADDWDIARAVVKHDDSRLWTPMEAYESLRKGGEAVQIWLDILKQGVPSFARVVSAHNLIPTQLRYELASVFAGNTVTPTFKCNYFALGTGSNAPAASDTTLQTESLRAAFSKRSSYQEVAYLDVFFPSSQVGGNTYTEAGIFVDATASANSGYLMSRTSMNQVMGANQSLTVNCSITVSS